MYRKHGKAPSIHNGLVMHIKQGFRSTLHCTRDNEARSVQDCPTDTLIPQIREWFPNGEKIVFMQDGAPCHTAKSIKTFLANESIELLDWPGNFPDLNPNENLWELVKRKISAEIITKKLSCDCLYCILDTKKTKS